MRTLIERLEFVLTVDSGDRVLTDAAVVVDGERFVDVGATADVVARHPRDSLDSIIDGRRRGMIPGFVDSHVHLSETLARAIFPDVVNTRAWVFHWAKPFYAHVDAADERCGALLGLAEMARSGTTCFLDMGAQNAVGGIVSAIEQIGLRGVTGRHAADVPPETIPPGWSPAMVEHHFFPSARVALEVLERTVREWNGAAAGRVRCWVNIEGKEPCSLELHVGARALAERLGVGTTYHLATSLEEAKAAERRYGVRPIQRIADAGGLGRNLVLAHAVAVDDSELAALAKAGTGVAFCPGTSLKMAKGATSIGRYPEMVRNGITVGLGTDGAAASGNLNLMRQMYLVAGLFKDSRIDPTLLGARTALRMATIDGARLLGWGDEIGSIEPGKRGDFVLFDLDHPDWVPYADPLQALVWSASTASIAATWVDGRPVFSAGRVSGVDETALREEARARAAAIVQRAGLGRATPTTTTLYD